MLAERQHHGQRTGPELHCQPLGKLSEMSKLSRHFDVCDMHDQRIEIRATLGSINGGNGVGIAGVTGKTIDRFGWHGDDLPLLYHTGRQHRGFRVEGHGPGVGHVRRYRWG